MSTEVIQHCEHCIPAASTRRASNAWIQQSAEWLPEGALRDWLIHSPSISARRCRRRIAGGLSFTEAFSMAMLCDPALVRHLVRQARPASALATLTWKEWMELLSVLNEIPPCHWPRGAEQWCHARDVMQRLDDSVRMEAKTLQRMSLPVLIRLRRPAVARQRLELRLSLIELCGALPGALDSLSLLGESALERLLSLVERAPFIAVPIDHRVQLTSAGLNRTEGSLPANATGLRATVFRDMAEASAWGKRVANCLGDEFHLARYWACCPVILGIRRGAVPVLTVAMSLRQPPSPGTIGLRVLSWQWVAVPDAEAREYAVSALRRLESALSESPSRYLAKASFRSPIETHPIRLWHALAAEIDLRIVELSKSGGRS